MNRTFGTVCLLAAPFMIAAQGCMVGPDYVRPQTPAAGAESYFNTPPGWVDPNNPEHIGRWWESFDDPIVDVLVGKALVSNYDLKAAAARVAESEALLAEVRGARFPQVSYALDRNRAKNTFFLLGQPLSTYTTIYNQGFSVSYIADLFGRLRRNEQAAFADLLASADSQQALVHSIIAQVVSTRVQITTQQRLLNIAEANIRSRQETLEIVERRYDQGLVPALDVYLARENLSSVKAAEPAVQGALVQARNSLNVLIGQRPGLLGPLPESLPELPPLGPVPLGVPAALLDRRPDVRAAESQLAAATDRVGASIAALFPDLTLTANWGTTADNFRGLGFTDAEVYNLLLSLAAPVFQGGRLKAAVDAAKARTEQAAANYAQVILGAMREVEDALIEQQTVAQRVQELEYQLIQARRAEALALERYQRGLEQILTVLDAERQRIATESDLAIAKGNLYNARISLYLALGGDWDIQPIVDEPKTNDVKARSDTKT